MLLLFKLVDKYVSAFRTFDCKKKIESDATPILDVLWDDKHEQ